MSRTIALFGGSFNPPGLHHRLIAEELERHFDEVVIVPWGPRPEKPTTNDVEPVHRATLADIAFRGLARTRVELFDLEQATFTPTDELDARFAAEGETWHVVGADLVVGGARGESFVQTHWEGGREFWEQLRFVVIGRRGYELDAADLPPHSRFLTMDAPTDVASAAIRELIFKREPFFQLVPPDVVDYIDRYGLYRGRIASRRTRFVPGRPRIIIFADERNERARGWAEKLREFECDESPTCIVALGGDGTMLRAIRAHWRRRLPFVGINAGHLGFLLNSPESMFGSGFPPGDLIVRQLPMLYVELMKPDGSSETALAFNDAWVERETSQSAWVKVKVNDRTRIAKLVADGVLVSTAAGSTAYARSMGCAPLLADTPGWLLAGSNVMSPPNWKSALLSTESTVELSSVGGEKRPLRAFVDGQDFGHVTGLCARQSRIAAVELGFCRQHDMAEKIAQIQFPADAA
jgi:nicotinate (nicotinamide) nucleotide adenylyltransferase